MKAGDDATLARRANDLTADLMLPDARIYWADLLATVVVLYASLIVAVGAAEPLLRASSALLCVLALYRAVSFIHELAHLQPGEIAGFKLAWNALVGVPFLVPSLLYEGVHSQHHATGRYGTAADPEYLPLARYSPLRLAGFLAVSLLAPAALFFRFGIAAPLAFASPRFRSFVTGRLSAMAINPSFRREDVRRARAPDWLAQEVACWLWSWTLAGLIISGAVPTAGVLTAAGILALATFVNQLRTAAAHAWTGDGRPMSFIAQFRDSVNVPPPALLPALWAPVGLRYHALHHLLPRLPYHNLAAAHRRLASHLPPQSAYRQVERSGLADALQALLGRSRADGARP